MSGDDTAHMHACKPTYIHRHYTHRYRQTISRKQPAATHPPPARLNPPPTPVTPCFLFFKIKSTYPESLNIHMFSYSEHTHPKPNNREAEGARDREGGERPCTFRVVDLARPGLGTLHTQGWVLCTRRIAGPRGREGPRGRQGGERPCTLRIGDLAHSRLGALHTQDCRAERQRRGRKGPRGAERSREGPRGGDERR